jgi:serine/threonine protein kinase
MTASIVGTAEYFAPEVIMGLGYGSSVDFWTLGVLAFEMLTGQVPFDGETQEDLFAKIMREEITLPRSYSSTIRDFVRQLTRSHIHERLTNIGEIKSHPFFEGMDWDKLWSRELKPPFMPKVSGMQDLKYFDTEFTKNKELNSSEMDIQATPSNKFEGYSYKVKEPGCSPTY